ncbi:glycosyl hydrolase [Glaciecola sp. KUL10]|uniref:glycosyl hydrolase n=1 Tax=Glaciecola sp. (strain KUL10) TaxID=2161813 RepID=UPI000D7873EE|nr:glycosyl hydrolase [Glaciecola sp. KUL10]
MNNVTSYSIFLTLCLSALGVVVKASADTLDPQIFSQPPQNYQPKTWMHAMNGNLNKSGFTGDFKAMSEAGIGGAIFFHIHRRNFPFSSRGPIRFGTDEFFDHLVHAAAEAEKNNIEFGLHNADGWTSSGGPWVTPEMSMKRITWSEQTVSGGQNYLPPQPGYYQGFYRDIALIALPENTYNQHNPFSNAKVSFSDPSLNPSLLTDKDWDTTVSFTKNEEENYWVQFELVRAGKLRSLHIETPNRHGEASLQISNDGVNFTTVVEKLRRPRPGARLWAFSPQLVDHATDGYEAKFFRIVFTKPITLKRFDMWSIPRFNDWFSLNAMERGRLSLAPQLPSEAITKFDNVLVLNRGDLPKDGIRLPEGNWRVLRFGYTSTGAFNVPATFEGEGLEVDKFDPKALAFHFDQYVGKLVIKTKALNINSIKTTEIDSYEVGGQNWTSGIEQSFTDKFDYDFIPWLPTMTGRVIESPEHTGAVLQEFRQHLSDLMVENYYGEFTRLANQYGLESYIEPYGWGPFDELAAGGKADRMMGEFWVKAPYYGEQYYHGRIEAAISSAHIYGKNIVSAEAFTSTLVNWYGHPYFYKHHGDNMWARGINETMFHRFAHQPNNNIKPGMTMDSIGSHIDRTQTWWKNGAVEWFDYLARGSYLLQQGVPDSDFLVHLGDIAPLRVTKREYVPEGFNFDHVNTDVLINRLSVDNGYLVLPEGTRYRALILSRTDYLHFKTLTQIEKLLAAGATIVGEKPQHVIGYSEWEDRKAFESLANKLWGNSSNTIRSYKKGTMSSLPLIDTIAQLNIQPDLYIDDQPVKHFAKRRIGENTLYFFHNDQAVLQHIEIDMRDGNGIAEIWNIDDGTIERLDTIEGTNSKSGAETRANPNLNYHHRLRGKLSIEPYGSRFILIRRDTQIPQYTGNHSQLVKDVLINSLDDSMSKTEVISGSWTVEFNPKYAGPGIIEFPRLINWKDHSLYGVKHYSGTAHYTKSIHVNANDLQTQKPIYLDLGEVQQIAELSVNGQKLKTLWKPPFAVNIRSALKPGANQISIAVTNTWVNRLIGDESLPDTSGYKMTGDTVPWLVADEAPPKSERVTFTGFNFFRDIEKQKLQSSGLLGPVRLIKM